jgi:hypothetical protein
MKAMFQRVKKIVLLSAVLILSQLEKELERQKWHLFTPIRWSIRPSIGTFTMTTMTAPTESGSRSGTGRAELGARHAARSV